MTATSFYFLEIIEQRGRQSNWEVRADLRYATAAEAEAKAHGIEKPGRTVLVCKSPGDAICCGTEVPRV